MKINLQNKKKNNKTFNYKLIKIIIIITKMIKLNYKSNHSKMIANF